MVTSTRFLALSLLVCAAPGGSQTAPVKPAVANDAPVAAEVFARLPALENPQLSPDGTRIAAKIAVDGAQHLVVLPLADHSKAAVIKGDPNQDLNWWRWVGDTHLAIGLGQQQTLLGEDVYVTRILGVSADLKQMRQLDWSHAGLRADDLLWVAHDGSPRIIYARQTGIESMTDIYPSVWESDLSTGKTRRITPGRTDVWEWFVDGAGVVRMGKRSADASGRTALLYRTRNEDAFQTIARHDRNDATSFVVPLTFRADGTALATDDTSGRDELYEVSLPDLKLGKKVFGVDRYDIDGVIENRAGDDVIGVGVTDTRQHIVWLDPTMKETQALADKAVGNRTARIVSRSADDSRMLVEVGSASQAGTLYIWDVADGAMRRYAYLNTDLGSRSLSPVKTVRYTARDGTPIEAVLTLPRHRAAKDLPLIVLPHGGPIARDREEWDWWTQYLAELGYAVIQPNYRGSSGYGTAFVKLGEGEWGLKMQDDLVDAIGYLAKVGIADPKRVCIAGASYGGYAALRAAQRDGASYRCAISYAGVSDLAGIKRYDAQFLNGATLGRYWSTRAPDLRAVSPRFGAEQVTIPILLMHGKADRRVPVRQSRDMAAALRAANKPFDYIEQPLADHHFTRSEDRLQFLKAMAAFLAKYNPA